MRLPTSRDGKLAVAFVALLGIALIAAAFIVFKLPHGIAFLSRTEEGIFEKLTVVFFGIAILLCLKIVIAKRWAAGIYITIPVVALAMREMDFHTRFTARNIASIRYWRAAEIALSGKILVAAILVVFFVCGIILLRRWFRPWLRDLRVGRPYAVFLAGSVLFTFISYALDHYLNMNALDDSRVLFLNLVEESIEVGIPILICAALVQGAITSRSQSTLSD